MHNHVLDYLYRIEDKKPDKTAYTDGTAGLTFKEVANVTRSVGSFLAGKGIYRKPVVVFMQKSAMEIASFFGVIAGGCYYVPLDEEMPGDRIRLILEKVNSPVMICDETTIEKANELKTEGQEVVLYSEVCNGEVNAEALQKIYDQSIDTNPIYIVFTSGSTGIPKGVVACHRSVIDYVEQLSEVLGFNENTVFGNQAPLYFDACLKELFPTLMFGATDYLIPKRLFSFPVRLMEYLNEYKINTICWVASALSIVSTFRTFDEITPQYLHTVAFGSEVFPANHLRSWQDVLPDATFFNLYGPTECTGMSCYYKVDHPYEENETVPIGKPFDNTEILLLTEDNRLAGDGETGEICIRGTAVTLGYYSDEERTAAVFVQNPLNTVYPEIIYRTGDIGKMNDKGELVYVSRKDFQIKHMGHRIELGEIEVNVDRIEGVQMAACIYDKEAGNILLCYTGSVKEQDLESIVKEKLPRYMLPRKVIRLARMPFTGNGKIDRVSLTKTYIEQTEK